MGPWRDSSLPRADYTYLAQRLNTLGLLYIHHVDHSPVGAPPAPDSIKAAFRKLFKRALILSRESWW